MAIEKWVAGSGVGLTWTQLFNSGADLASLPSADAIASSTILDNSTAFDLFCDVSIALASAAFVAPNFIGVYFYPLNQDGTTYGDGRFQGAAAAGPPSSAYYAGIIPLVAATQAQEGILRGILLPPGKGKFVVYNGGGVALGTTNTFSYRTYNLQVA